MDFVTTVGGTILSSLFQSSLDSLTTNETLTYTRGSRVLEEVRRWEPMLRAIFEALEDAEKQQMTNGTARSWFIDIRNLAYDVDDILDELITHVRQSKFYAETSSSRVEKLLCSGLNLRTRVKFSSGMVSGVKTISLNLGRLKEQMYITREVGNGSRRVNGARPTTSLPETKIFGREDDRRTILDMMKNEDSGGRVSVIAIVGMGGVGKTTLAQMVYNDESLQYGFKAWVSIGETFDLITVTKTIVQSEGSDLNSLQSQMKEKLFGKKFLVVLDNLWSHDYGEWTCFYRSLAFGAPGSKIIITTRNNKVSSMTSYGDSYPLSYNLDILSNDDCLSLFLHHADKEDFSGHMSLMEVGKEITKKCKGLPLAAKIFGSLLKFGPLDDWKNLLEHKFPEANNKIAATLRLSYDDLPPLLRRCFAYCAIFPKEYEFDRDSLVLLWQVEGLAPNLSKGYDYFDELFARSLFQKSAKDTSLFVMHDLIHDLARSVSGGVCFNLDESSYTESYTKVRHSAFNRGESDFSPRLKNFKNMKCLRTILALPIFEEGNGANTCFISSNTLDVFFLTVKCLRVLSLSGYKIAEVPKSIDVLQHLRYLNFSRTEIVALPESLCKLFNLQVLILRHCKNLRRLPGDLCNLINLQCLDLKDTDSLEGMPSHIGNLSKLHTLNKFIVGSTNGCRIKELLKIPNLHGEVHVKELQNAVSTDCSKMKEKEKVDGLVLEWTSNFGANRDEKNEKKVLEVLQPQKNIARMSVKSYGGLEFPSWFGNDSLKLTVLEIHNCHNVSTLPLLGRLPLLKELRIEGMNGVKEVGEEFYGVLASSCSNVFPSLEILNFKDMENWKTWYSSLNNVGYKGQVFPKLRKLGIMSCPELIGDFPKGLPCLEELVIDNCGKVQHLWGSGTEIKRFTCLKDLKISNCSNLETLVKGEEGIITRTFQQLDISLELFGCPKLKTIGDL